MPKAILIEQNLIRKLTKNLIRDNSSNAVISKSSRFTIGTSTNGWTQSKCDYLCDGTADEVEINAAIQALPEAGGRIIFLDGTYNITAPINIDKSGIILKGNGNSTILKRAYNSDSTSFGLVTCDADNIILDSFAINGDNATYTGANNYSIFIKGKYNIINNIRIANDFSGIVLDSLAQYSTITNNLIEGNTHSGITLFNSNYNIINSNVIQNNQAYGIYLHNYAEMKALNKNNIIRGNTLTNNTSGNIVIRGEGNLLINNITNGGEYGIYLISTTNADTSVSYAQSNIVSSNICTGSTSYNICCCGHNNLLIGNQVQNGTNGILISKLTDSEVSKCNSVLKNLVSGCTTSGINIQHSYNSNINSNLVRATTNSNSIALVGTDNTNTFITGNDIFGKDYLLEGGTGNYFFNNFTGVASS